MNRFHHGLAALASAVACLAATPACAGLLGDQIGFRVYAGASDGTPVQAVTVAGGAEANLANVFFFDLTDSGFIFTSTRSFCGIFDCSGPTVSVELTDLDLGAAITDVTFSSSLVGVTRTFTADSVILTWDEQSVQQGIFLSGSFVTGGSNAVPEPGSLALASLALLAVGAATRVRRG